MKQNIRVSTSIPNFNIQNKVKMVTKESGMRRARNEQGLYSIAGDPFVLEQNSHTGAPTPHSRHLLPLSPSPSPFTDPEEERRTFSDASQNFSSNQLLRVLISLFLLLPLSLYVFVLQNREKNKKKEGLFRNALVSLLKMRRP